MLSRLSHNLRNHLNTASLEVDFAREMTADAEVRSSLQQIRASLGRIEGEIETLRRHLGPEKPSLLLELGAGEAYAQLAAESGRGLSFPQPTVWEPFPPGLDGPVELDLERTFAAVREVLENAFWMLEKPQVRAVRVHGRRQEGRLEVTIVEPKAAAPAWQDWGVMPFTTTDPSRFGLGLWRVRRHLQMRGGRVDRAYDASQREFSTRLVF